MVGAVIFDLDETLLDRTTSLKAFLTDQHVRFRSALGDVDAESWRERFLALDGRGSVHKSLVYPALLREFGGDPSASPDLLDDYAENCCRHAVPFEGMVDVLSTLRARGKRLAIVSNGETAFQGKHIAALRLNARVDEVLVSQAEGVRKPAPELFRRAAARLGTEPCDCVFVGDNPSADILGAFGAGMRTIWFRGGQTWPRNLPPNPGGSIDTLPELLELIP